MVAHLSSRSSFPSSSGILGTKPHSASREAGRPLMDRSGSLLHQGHGHLAGVSESAAPQCQRESREGDRDAAAADTATTSQRKTRRGCRGGRRMRSGDSSRAGAASSTEHIFANSSIHFSPPSSTVSLAGCLLRALLAAGGTLGHFSRTSLWGASTGPSKPTTQVWPIPPPDISSAPSPRRGGRRLRAYRILRATDSYLTAVLLVLNFMALGSIAVCPAEARIGRPLSTLQMQITQRMRGSIRTWLCDPPWAICSFPNVMRSSLLFEPLTFLV